jgi:predicted RNA-binding Zn-ribbon protein involved in translation (DUF1610 family)
MLTPDQADGAAKALLSPPLPQGVFACPACGVKSITSRDRRRLGLLGIIQCGACGATLRLKWGRELLAAYVAFIVVYGVWLFVGWRSERYVATLGGTVAFVLIVVFTSINRRLPLIRG